MKTPRCAIALLIAASPAFAEEAKELNVFSWSEYIPQKSSMASRRDGHQGGAFHL
ncbi:MAG: hypothetical protein ACLSTO_02130 [Bilophila wadsworthia]